MSCENWLFIGLFIIKILYLCRKWVWREAIASVTSTQNMTSAACLTWSGVHVRFVGGQSGCLDEACFVCYGVRISAIVERLGGYCCVSIICLIVRHALQCRSRRLLMWMMRCAVIWLHKVGLQLFRLKFVVFSFNVASEVTEIGRISVVMHVSD